MHAAKLAAAALIVGGTLGLAFDRLGDTEAAYPATLGLAEFGLEDRLAVEIPIWASVDAIALGSVLLLLGGRRS